MEQKIAEKINEIKYFFNYFYLNQENFSKNIQLQLNLLKPLLKFDKDLLSSIERDKLIFVQSENLNKIIKNSIKESNEKENNDLINLKKLDLLLSIIRRLNMDLKYNKDKLITNIKSNEIELEKELKDNNYDLLMKTYDEKFGKINDKINKSNNNNMFISNDDIEKNKNVIVEQKNEIDDIVKKNKELDLILYDLKKQLNNFKDLPTEVDQMKNLVEIKKEEYKALLIDKKVKNL